MKFASLSTALAEKVLVDLVMSYIKKLFKCFRILFH